MAICRHNNLNPRPNIYNTIFNKGFQLRVWYFFFFLSEKKNGEYRTYIFCLQTLSPARILSLSVENKFHGSLMGYVLVSDIDHPQATAEQNFRVIFVYVFSDVGGSYINWIIKKKKQRLYFTRVWDMVLEQKCYFFST